MAAPAPFQWTPDIRTLIELFFGAQIRTAPREQDVSVGANVVQLGQWARTRSAIGLGNNGSAAVQWSFSPNVTSTTGMPLPAGQTIFFGWYLDNETVTYDIYAVSSAGTNSVHVIEYVMAGV